MTIFDAITSALQNQLVTGGLVLGITGGIIAALRNAPKQFGAFLKDRFSCSIEIRDEQVFAALAEWLSIHRYGARCRRIAAHFDHQTNVLAPPGEKAEPSLIFSPGRGHHVFRHGRKTYWLERAKDDMKGDDFARRAREYMMLRMWGTDTAPGKAILKEAAEYVNRKKRGKAVVYIKDGYSSWGICSMGDGRPLGSVILRAGLLEDLAADIEWFFASRDRYTQLGIPYRRGYLLEGPPGCGKSSVVTALAAHFSAPMYQLPLAGAGISDEQLLLMMRATQPGSIILIEDVDAAFDERKATEKSMSNSLTFKGLINAIDGVASQEGRIIVFTTNHPEKLDPALVRPGRVDMRRTIDLCDNDQLRRIFLRFFPNREGAAHLFIANNMHQQLAPCAVQDHLLAHIDDVDGATGAVMMAITPTNILNDFEESGAVQC